MFRYGSWPDWMAVIYPNEPRCRLGGLEYIGGINDWFYSSFPFPRLDSKIGGGVKLIVVLTIWVLLALHVVLDKSGTKPKPQASAEERWKQLEPQGVRTLCLWYTPDEAYWGLRLLRFIGGWAHSLVSAATAYFNPLITGVAVLFAAWNAFSHRSERPRRPEPDSSHAENHVDFDASGLCLGRRAIVFVGTLRGVFHRHQGWSRFDAYRGSSLARHPYRAGATDRPVTRLKPPLEAQTGRAC